MSQGHRELKFNDSVSSVFVLGMIVFMGHCIWATFQFINEEGWSIILKTLGQGFIVVIVVSIFLAFNLKRR